MDRGPWIGLDPWIRLDNTGYREHICSSLCLPNREHVLTATSPLFSELPMGQLHGDRTVPGPEPRRSSAPLLPPALQQAQLLGPTDGGKLDTQLDHRAVRWRLRRHMTYAIFEIVTVIQDIFSKYDTVVNRSLQYCSVTSVICALHLILESKQ